MKQYEPPDKFKEELVKWAIELDCGHKCTIGHNFGNTIVITPGSKKNMVIRCSE